MGNAISDTVGKLDETKTIGKYVKNWALNDYTVNSNFKERDQMKKRACCLSSREVPIGLPSFLNNKYVPVVSVDVNVFGSAQIPRSEQCRFQLGSGISSYLGSTQGGSTFTGNTEGADACKKFYATGNSNDNKGFCYMVRENRFESYGNKIADSIDEDGTPVQGGYKEASLYGPNADTSAPNQLLNQYIDCNCENSRFKLDEGLMTSLGADAKTNADAFAQSFDQRCGGISSKTWKDAVKSTQICINQAVFTNVTALGGKLNVQQACKIEGNTQNNQAAPTQAPPTAAPTAAPTQGAAAPPPSSSSSSESQPTTDNIPDSTVADSTPLSTPTSAPDFLKDNMMYIAIGGGVLLLLIILVIAFSGDSGPDPYTMMMMQQSRRSRSSNDEDDE
jgi:hypothetical protein